jgi:hypothetical protein
MTRYWRLALGALLPAVLAAGCSDWLDGPKLTEDPNNPTAATRDNLLTSVQTGQTVFQTGDLARVFSMWMQQMAGTDRQFVSLGTYSYGEDAFSADWAALYAGGGLVDIRALESEALSAGDTLYAGIGYVLEAFTVGPAADIWGDVPYSEAISDVLQPKLDPQLDVYAAIQAKLDTALAYLACSSASCVGPGLVDLWYSGDAAKWRELARTLKARYYMHVAEVDPASYALALAQTDSGISAPANDLISYQSSIPQEQNIWYQFISKQRQGYISAGAFLLDTLLEANSDPRLSTYFDPLPNGTFQGATPGQTGDFSQLGSTRNAPAFQQPMVTFAENQLIRAEAALATGNQAAADAAYTAERESFELPGGSGVTLQQVMTEKYIALFQNGIEVWNDYKRTCLPAITPAASSGVPRRLLYPLSAERNANPNVPPPDEQLNHNPNDPNACTTP